jgi:hypothetical protein
MKTHSRCCHCGKRRKLPRHPDEYRLQPKCTNCGARSWRKDNYRHQVELEQMRTNTGRYRVCHSDCHAHPHRAGSNGCKFDVNFEYRDGFVPAYS